MTPELCRNIFCRPVESVEPAEEALRAAAGGGAVFKEGLSELLVEVVCHRSRDSLPGQNEDHQHGRVTEVAWPPSDQTQQLLLLTATPDHLSEDFPSLQEQWALPQGVLSKFLIGVSRKLIGDSRKLLTLFFDGVDSAEWPISPSVAVDRTVTGPALSSL
ncbi:hypothetical protein EYF80_014479 [Liparis tanakae]|uniref:Uncharacterized protein n=1 Tax=Liparis tanakae TaxID=230148 RepID=A0A4Z2ICU1_9TELE|nr:hypothetical protein EYF80_014479 [Liparis tanakae]